LERQSLLTARRKAIGFTFWPMVLGGECDLEDYAVAS